VQSLGLTGSLLLGALVGFPATAAQVDVTYVGTWDSIGAGNPTGVGGPGISAGQKYVIRVSYDDASATSNGVPVLTEVFADSGSDMTTIQMSGGSNTLDIFAPMEGLDAGTPFIYTQNQGDHFGSFIPTPTLNFIDGSPISDPANIIGMEFEGNLFPGSGNNFIEIYNTAPSGGAGPISLVSRIVNFGVDTAASDTVGLSTAVDLIVDAGPDIVYSAGDLTKSTASSVVQSNDLGAGRSDGEDFVDVTWSQTGTPSGNDIAVAIANSGLASTIDTAIWTMNASEQMTGKTDSDTLQASYLNAIPTINATATANAGNVDFTLSVGDLDLAVNALIADFEMLIVSAMVGAIDATALFADLISSGLDSLTNAELEGAFGAGPHSVLFTVTDRAGGTATASAAFDVTQTPAFIPEPGALLLLAGGLLIMAGQSRSNRRTKVNS
jgi:hypothetical protein